LVVVVLPGADATLVTGGVVGVDALREAGGGEARGTEFFRRGSGSCYYNSKARGFL
jgi:hypothetical protein